MKNSRNKNSIVYWGTPDFSSKVLQSLCDTAYKPDLVITMPDRRAGRKKIITSPAVKIISEKNNIRVLQPEKLDNEFTENLLNKKYDLFIVFAYGNIIPKNILEIPAYKTINIHGSLLPKYRGASPVQTAILNGDKTTGITLMLMDEKLDYGDIIAQKEIKIEKTETYESLINKMAEVATPFMLEILPKWFEGKIQPIHQDHKKASYTKILNREDGRIEWDEQAKKIEAMVRAFTSYPGTFTVWRDKRLKIIESELSDHENIVEPGKVIQKDNGIIVACKNSVIKIKKLQLEGEKIKTAQDFIKNHSGLIGAILG